MSKPASTSAPGAGGRAVSARRSPPTARVVRIIEALSDAAPERLGVSELARRLGLDASTCLGIANELVIAGWLVRHPDGPTYTLGPGLVVTARAAQRSRPGLGAAREVAAALAARLEVVCTVACVATDQILVLERAGQAAGLEPFVEAGVRFPFVAPVGVMFAAWADEPTVDDWLARAPVTLDPARVARMRQVVRTCREQGWLAERLTDAELELHQFLPGITRGTMSVDVRNALAHAAALFSNRDYVVGELEQETRASVSTVSAPTFDADGRPDLILSIYLMRRDLPASRIRRFGAELRAACDGVTATVAGFDPWASR